MEAPSSLCQQCGAPLRAGAGFCESCGQPVAAAPASPPEPEGRPFGESAEAQPPAAAEEPKPARRKRASARAGQADASATEPPLEWECRVPMLTNRFILWDMVRVFLIAILISEGLAPLVTYLVDGEPFFLPPQVWLIPMGILAVLYVLVTGGILGNRLDMRFTLNAKQVIVESRPAATSSKIIKVLRVLTSLLSGKYLKAWVASNSKPGEVSGVNWAEVERIKVYPRQRVINLCDSWHTLVRLYCPPEVFDRALARCQAQAEPGMRRREKRIAERPRPAWGFWAVWLVLAVAGTLASGAWYWAADLRDRFALLAGALVLLAGLFRETVAWLFGAAGILSGLIVLGALVLPALERDTDAWGAPSYGFRFDTGWLLLSLAGVLLLVGMGLYRVRGHGPGTAPRAHRTRKA